MMEIGLFQLESLMLNPNMFLLIDMRADRGPAGPPLDPLLSRARHVVPEQLQSYLVAEKIPRERPLVLLCGDGRVSQAAASALEAAGFDQVYIVAGGLSGLLSEI